MRKNIFDIASATINIANEVDRIVKMSFEEKNLVHCFDSYSVVEFVDKYCFKNWSRRGHFIDVVDFLESIEFVNIRTAAGKGDVDAFLTLIEVTYNFWNLVYQDVIDEASSTKLKNNFFHLRDVMLDNLEKYNHKAYVEDDRILVIEDKPEVTAVAEIVEHDIGTSIIRYNHRSLQGDLGQKKTILFSLGAELEPKRKELQVIDKQLSDDIFYLLNNLDIRHNNRSKNDKRYKEYIAKMRKNRLEKWYDELYQMILLAFLLLDNAKRRPEVKILKRKIEGEAY